MFVLIDVLFEVTTEIKRKDWVTPGGSELRRDLLESIRSHVSLGMVMGRKGKCYIPKAQLLEITLCSSSQGFSVNVT